MTADLMSVAGVAETALTAALAQRLPENAAEAPWTCECNAVLWTSRATAAARDALPFTERGRPHALAVVGGFVSYSSTPVGAYDEVLGAVGFREKWGLRGSVAFMAVDSETSLVGGRTNWAMPKTLARFGGTIGAEKSTARGQLDARWSVSATPKTLGPALPVVSSARVVQRFADGTLAAATMRAKGRARPALVQVDTTSDGDLANWLRSGRHLGAVLESVTFTLGEAEPLR